MVIGAGGAARAILFALSRVGVGRVTILNRNVLKAAALARELRAQGRCAAARRVRSRPPALLVNASALGMVGQPPLDLDLSPLPEDAVVYDIVYAPLETAAARRRRARASSTRSTGSTC